MSGVIDLPKGWGRLRPCSRGWFLYNVNDRYVGRSLDLYGEYSETEAALLVSLLRPGDIVVEAGANIGALTVPMAEAVGPTGVVLAYEPQRIVHQMLCANVALNGLTNVIARQAAAGRERGTAFVPVLPQTEFANFGDVSLEGCDERSGVEVPVESVDDVHVGRCRLIKADVQGMESDVLEGARRTIAAHRPALYVENDDRGRSPGLIALIRSLGYRLWWHTPAIARAAAPGAAGDGGLAGFVSLNLLCLPLEAEVELDGREILDENDWPDGVVTV